MATVGAKALRRPPPGHPAPGRGINIDSAPGGGGGFSTGTTRRVASEGHALGEALVIARAAQPGPSEPVGSPACLQNPARRARGSGFAQFPHWSSDAGPRLGRECRSQRPRPCMVRPGLLLGPGPGPLQGSATPTLVSPGADPNAKAPAVRRVSHPQTLPRASPVPFPQHPGSLDAPNWSLPGRPPLPARLGRPTPFSGSQGAEDPRPPPHNSPGPSYSTSSAPTPLGSCAWTPRPSAPLPRAAPARPALRFRKRGSQKLPLSQTSSRWAGRLGVRGLASAAPSSLAGPQLGGLDCGRLQAGSLGVPRALQVAGGQWRKVPGQPGLQACHPRSLRGPAHGLTTRGSGHLQLCPGAPPGPGLWSLPLEPPSLGSPVCKTR